MLITTFILIHAKLFPFINILIMLFTDKQIEQLFIDKIDNDFEEHVVSQ